MNSNTSNTNNSENDHSASSMQDEQHGVNIDDLSEEENAGAQAMVGANRTSAIDRSDGITGTPEEEQRNHLVIPSSSSPPSQAEPHQPIASHQFILERQEEPTSPPTPRHGRTSVIESSIFNDGTRNRHSPHNDLSPDRRHAENDGSPETIQHRIAAIIERALLVSSSTRATMPAIAVSPSTTTSPNSTAPNSMINFLDLAGPIQPPPFSPPPPPGSCDRRGS